MVALVMVGQQCENRDIVIESHSNVLRRLSQIHRLNTMHNSILYCTAVEKLGIQFQFRNQTPKPSFS